MEHSSETSHVGTSENGKNSSKLLDMQKLYDAEPWVSGRKGSSQSASGSGSGSGSSSALKRKSGSEECQKRVRKKSKKGVLLSSLSSGTGRKSNNKSSGEVDEGGVGKSESRADRKVNGIGGLGGISHSLNANINIPKRPRDLVGRKKVVDPGIKQVGTSSSKGGLDEGGGKLNGNLLGESLLQNDNVGARRDVNGEFNGVPNIDFIASKVKHKRDSDYLRERRSNESDSQRNFKKVDSHLSVPNGDAPTTKVKSSHKKTKQTRTKKQKETKPALVESSRICDSSHDEEENLEENAARMLSSRFDTSCTGYSSSGVKSSKFHSTNGLNGLISSTGDATAPQYNLRVESEVVSSDAEVRVLRPRDQLKGKGLLKKRRHFYEVLSREMDSYWVLNRRIKVFWPLDQSWYGGQVIGYDPDRKCHHIKYDDRDEEWVDLQNERFKLLLLPSEVPGKVLKKKSKMHDNQTRNIKCDEAINKESNSTNSYVESEPIISWLARSARQKSPSFRTRKRQKTLDASMKSQSSSFSERKIDPQGSLEVGSSGRNADDLGCSYTLPDNPADSLRNRKALTENTISRNCKLPIVYSRKRFHRRGKQQCDNPGKELCELLDKDLLRGKGTEFIDSFDLVADMLQSMVEYSHMVTGLSLEEFIWNTDDSGLLKLTAPVTNLKVLLKLCFPLPVRPRNLFGDCYVHLCGHGSLISVWPMVHLEMLFVDNIVGVRFLLYEGCLKKAVLLAFLVLDVFHQSNQKVLHFDEQLPVTSVRFKLTGLQALQKQLIFAFYNFRELANSKWSYLDRKLKKHCLLTKQLPPSECTYDNIKALRNGCNRLPFTRDSHKPSSLTNLRRRSREKRMNIFCRQSTSVRRSTLPSDTEEKLGKVPSFALSFAAAPTFFLSLHLKLLMERSIPPSSIGELDPVSLLDLSDNIGLVRADSFTVENNALSVGGNMEVLSKNRSRLVSCPNPDLGVGILDQESKSSVSSQEFSDSDATIKITSSDHTEKAVDGRIQNTTRPVVLALDVSSCAIRSPDSTASHSIWHQSRVVSSRSLASVNISPTLPDGKQDMLRNGFGNGPKKPRTQVSYSLPFGGHDSTPKYKIHHTTGFPHKRIRRASEKKTSESLSTSQTNGELLSCNANVLITVADRGWRECGAKVVLELVHHEWRLSVKISGNTKYSYKAHQFLQPGTTNRYTHVMMWKGGKDWILEFPDRSQWAIFKEMHEECYNKNFRAASVKNIPIPGVRLVEADDNVPEVPFSRSCLKYYRQVETDVDIATDPGCILYDMDSDDEQWITEIRASDAIVSGCEDISDEMFEKIMDVFEKVAYSKQRDHLSSDDLEDLSEFGPMEAMRIIYEHWREKRLRKGRPLIRHLQPPLWEKYQKQVKEWEQATMKNSGITFEKPSMFAFCLKPRGMEMPNRGSKQRSQKRLPIGYLSSAIPGDQDAFHLVGRRHNGYYSASDSSPVLQGSARVYSPRDAGNAGYFSLSSDGEKSHYPKLYRNQSKKLCFMSSPSNDHHPDGFRRRSFEQLDPSELDEFRLRDAASAARHAITIAKMKRENAQRMLCRADLAMHKAVAAIMTAQAIDASYKEPDNDA